MIPIIFKDSSPQSVDGSGNSDSDEQSVDSSSDSDSEASDPEALLYFPDPDEQGGYVAPELHHSDEKNDLAELETYCDLPSTVQNFSMICWGSINCLTHLLPLYLGPGHCQIQKGFH